jgi:hypothetical protein
MQGREALPHTSSVGVEGAASRRVIMVVLGLVMIIEYMVIMI